MAKKNNKKKHNESFLEKTQELWKKFDDTLFENVDCDDKGQKFYFSVFEVVCLVLIGILFGVIIGYVLTYTRHNSNDIHLKEITSTYNNIVDNYYDSVDKDKLMNGAIEGMIKSLDDPYSTYLDKNNTSSFNQTVDGSFVGIGVVVMYDGEYNKIVEITPNGPAEKASLQKDDIIIKIDDADAKGLYGSKLTDVVRGKEGSEVKITVRRGEEELDFVLKRDLIEVTSVTSNTIEDDNYKIGYIKIENFSAVSYKQFEKNLIDLEKKGINSLIIDVRNNPGGHLDQVNKILSLFFDKKTVLYQIQTKKKTTKVYSHSNESRKYDVVILTNGNSASASEILASCFRENYKNSSIVGLKTYGKGTVQKSQNLSSGTSFKYTTEKWLTSKGKWINREGIYPDIVMEPSEDYLNNPIFENDNQLQIAVNKIKESK